MEVQGSFSTRRWTVGALYAGSRLDSFLRAQLPLLPRRVIDTALSERCFSVNERKARKGERLSKGDIVQFSGPAAIFSDAPIPNPRLTVPVVYEDGDLLALNKPAGMDCHGFSGRDDETLANFLLAGWPNLSGVGANRWQPGLVHRIDRETSGVVLIAKSQTAFDDLRRQFRSHEVKKSYLALVRGRTAEEGTVSFPLAHDSGDARKMRAIVSAGTRPTKKKIWQALTRYRKLAERPGLSLLEVEMETGVTHQIRVHLAAISHAIVGDVLYGVEGQENFNLRRHFLHADKLRLMHPIAQSLLVLKAPLPDELAAVIARIGLRL